MDETPKEKKIQIRSKEGVAGCVCPNCGYVSDAKFCVKCGAALNGTVVENNGEFLPVKKSRAGKIMKKKLFIASIILVLCIIGTVILGMNSSQTYKDSWNFLSYEVPNELEKADDNDTVIEYKGDDYLIRIFMYESSSTLGTSDEWLGTARSLMNDRETIVIGGVSGIRGTSQGSLSAAFSWNNKFVSFALRAIDGDVTDQQKVIFDKFLESIKIEKQ